jgi:PAS domain S-box-containing protein
LLASEQKYHTLFAQMDSGCALQEIIRDEAGNAVDYVTLEVNDSYGKILGVKREDVVGRKASEILPGDELRKWVGVFGGVALTGKPASYEMYSPVNDKYFEGNAFCPEPGRFVCIFSDITERKRAEEELKASNELLGLFIKESPIYAFIKSVSPAESKVLFASENYRDMVGIPGSEMIGKNMRELFPPEFAEKITADDNKVVSDGKSISLDEFLNERSYLTYKFPIKQGNRNLLAGYTIDVTERNKAEESLANMQKLESLGLLAGGIAHDFNNLLGGIYGYMDMAGEIATDRRVSQYISKAMSTIDRGRHLTQQLLTFSKGGAPIKSVAKLFPHVRETAQFALSGSNITCSFDVAEGLHACNFDKNQIAQVIDNIVINAKQAMPDGGKMEIAARNIAIGEGQHAVLGAGDYVKISIRDHGIGMPSEILTRIFDPFYTTKATGHGLGLASCYSIIKRHDGCIEVESEPGKGSVFHVFLPATAQDSERPETDPYGKHEGSGVFIVMDDEEIMRETMSDMLESFGYRAMCVEDGQEAVERLAAAMAGKNKVVGLILDLTIPGGMGGKEAIGEIKKINASIPVFVASGYAEDPVMANPREYGFMASIRKPFRKGDLAEMLNKHLGDAR